MYQIGFVAIIVPYVDIKSPIDFVRNGSRVVFMCGILAFMSIKPWESFFCASIDFKLASGVAPLVKWNKKGVKSGLFRLKLLLGLLIS